MSRHSYVVVVESDGGRKSRTVGPYRSNDRATTDARDWDGKDGRRAWVEPVYSPEEFRRDPKLPVDIH